MRRGYTELSVAQVIRAAGGKKALRALATERETRRAIYRAHDLLVEKLLGQGYGEVGEVRNTDIEDAITNLRWDLPDKVMA